eukprot:TRINITY_DN2509_c0_g1_i1.p1 TRINITY_DN2509_c0_g1~~TRINITY_DN2509_c0_g1_i1.p1  ORF type:complete len:378 (-),score=84.87 TRINITY_DN2509_c0_g1_i1:706-1746(-)
MEDCFGMFTKTEQEERKEEEEEEEEIKIEDIDITDTSAFLSSITGSMNKKKKTKKKKKTVLDPNKIDFRSISPDELGFKGYVKIRGHQIITGEFDVNVKPGLGFNRTVEAEIRHPISLKNMKNALKFLKISMDALKVLRAEYDHFASAPSSEDEAHDKEIEEVEERSEDEDDEEQHPIEDRDFYLRPSRRDKFIGLLINRLNALLDNIDSARDQILAHNQALFPDNAIHSSHAKKRLFSPNLPQGIVVEFNVFDQKLVTSLYLLKIGRPSSPIPKKRQKEATKKRRLFGNAATIGEALYIRGHKIQVLDYISIFSRVPLFSRIVASLSTIHDLAAEWLHKVEVLQV